MSRLSPEHILRGYFHAKDENRPHLLGRVFAEDAKLEIQNRSSAITFPAVTFGREAIANVLVRDFGRTYENVYSFYMARPVGHESAFSCDWLVVMTDKTSHAVRIGCGRYEWAFAEHGEGLASHLCISIEAMQVLPGEVLAEAVQLIRKLTYPWASAAQVIEAAHKISGVEPVLAYLGRNSASAA